MMAALAAVAVAVQRVGRGEAVVGMADCPAQVGKGAQGEDLAAEEAVGREA